MSRRTIRPTTHSALYGRQVQKVQKVQEVHDDGSGQEAEDDSELLLLALLEQLHSDRAAGLHRDLTAYCAANPELADAFLELAPADDLEDTSIQAREEGVDPLPLSPGVQRALASIPEFAGDMTGGADARRQRRRVAEKTPSYHPRNTDDRS